MTSDNGTELEYAGVHTKICDKTRVPILAAVYSAGGVLFASLLNAVFNPLFAIGSQLALKGIGLQTLRARSIADV